MALGAEWLGLWVAHFYNKTPVSREVTARFPASSDELVGPRSKFHAIFRPRPNFRTRITAGIRAHSAALRCASSAGTLPFRQPCR